MLFSRQRLVLAGYAIAGAKYAIICSTAQMGGEWRISSRNTRGTLFLIRFLLSLILPLICILGFANNAAADDKRHYSIEAVKVHQGDNSLWAQADFDDRDWLEHQAGSIPEQAANYWFRFYLTVNDQLASHQTTQLFFHHVGSSEIYWDDRLIDRNGTIGTDKASEVAGDIDRLLVVPHDLYQPGQHVVAIRISRHHSFLARTGLSFDFELGPYGETYTQHTGTALLPLITLGGTLVVAGYFIFIFLLDLKQRSYLYFGLTCLGVAGMLIGETWRGLFGYTYDWHIIRLQLILTFATLVALSLPWFVYQHFKLYPLKKPLLMVSVLLLIFINWSVSYDLRSAVVLLLGLLAALVLSLMAWRQQAVGAAPMFVGIGLSFIIGLSNPWIFLDTSFYYGFVLMTLFILASMAVQNKLHQQQRDTALLHSERLKTELLKKNIQPHFILNSLTTLTSWISINVDTAQQMIQSLADEFRLLMDMSALTQVPLSQELALCRSHLQIMGFRQDQTFELVLNNKTAPDPQGELLLPPGILHTLLENALSHNRYRQSLVTFTLQLTIINQRAQLMLFVPVSKGMGKGLGKGKGKDSSDHIASGTGTQYIQARLEEVWPGDWTFDSVASGDNWLTTIDFPVVIGAHN
ncbi:MAG: hypothetical protein ACI8WB_004249 [Phenylobacterium sp.]|jgi:hypothetical protein